MFQELLKIKTFREDAAKRAVKVAEMRLTERLKAVRDAETALDVHIKFRVEEEKRLFEELKGEEVHLSDLEDMKQAVALLRNDELRLREKIEEERNLVPPAQTELSEAKETHAAAITATEKFRQFVAIQRQEEAKEASFKEDAEAEEVVESIVGARAAFGGRQ